MPEAKLNNYKRIFLNKNDSLNFVSGILEIDFHTNSDWTYDLYLLTLRYSNLQEKWVEYEIFRIPNKHIEFQKNSFFSRQKKKREFAHQQTINSISSISVGGITENTKNTDFVFPFTKDPFFDEINTELEIKKMSNANFKFPEIKNGFDLDPKSEEPNFSTNCFKKVNSLNKYPHSLILIYRLD